MSRLDFKQIDNLIDIALKEDVGTGDITTDTIIPPDQRAKALLTAKADGVIAGLLIAERVFRKLDSGVRWQNRVDDGKAAASKTVIAEVEGKLRALLTGERVALNFLQRMSGIATETSKYVSLLKSYRTKILDTRKTLPGHRMLDKYAVNMGGGTNHRIGLYDMVMIKDNHIKAAGNITKAVEAIKGKVAEGIKIEVETTNLDEVKEALEAKADIIMLDNMSTDLMRKANRIIDGKAKVEASGSMNLERLKEVAVTGVDFISVGAVTHSVKALDISMNIV